MSLANDLKQYLEPNKTCPVCEWYLTLDPADQEAFDDYVPSGGTRSSLHKISVKNGLKGWRGKLYEHVDECHEPG